MKVRLWTSHRQKTTSPRLTPEALLWVGSEVNYKPKYLYRPSGRGKEIAFLG